MKGDNAAYSLIDLIFTRKLMTKFSWAGGYKKGSSPKKAFKQFVFVIGFFYELVRLADPSYTKVAMENFFKLKVLPNCNRRSSAPMIRASRAKARARSAVTKGVAKGRFTKRKKIADQGSSSDDDGSADDVDNVDDESKMRMPTPTENEVIVLKYSDATIAAPEAHYTTIVEAGNELPEFSTSFNVTDFFCEASLPVNAIATEQVIPTTGQAPTTIASEVEVETVLASDEVDPLQMNIGGDNNADDSDDDSSSSDGELQNEEEVEGEDEEEDEEEDEKEIPVVVLYSDR